MKTQIIFIASILFSLLFFSGCKSEEKQGPLLQEEVQVLKEIEQRSEDIGNSEDAFNVLRDLNQTLQDIREGILAMEKEYYEATDHEKQQLESEFNNANSEIDQSLEVISNNIEPYRENERVSKMLDKLNQIMISK